MAMHVVMTSSAQMPSSVRSPYVWVAVVQLSQEYTAQNKRPKMISLRARGVLALNVLGKYPANGKTMRSGYQQALAEAQRMADAANAAGDTATAELLISTGSA